jgi:dihydrodipicolinate synthase/N-acetylneuraminate lyase
VLPNEFWSRVFTFVPTATKNDGEEIDEKRLLETIDYQIENGVDGICIFGSTGGNGSFTRRCFEQVFLLHDLRDCHANGVAVSSKFDCSYAAIELSRTGRE